MTTAEERQGRIIGLVQNWSWNQKSGLPLEHLLRTKKLKRSSNKDYSVSATHSEAQKYFEKSFFQLLWPHVTVKFQDGQ